MGLETGSFEHDFVAMYYIQSGIPVLFTAPIVQRGLEAAQPETSGECGPWVVPGLGTARNCGWILSLVPHVRVLLLSLREQDSKNTLALKDLNYLELQICILAPAVHTHTLTHIRVFWIPCTKCGYCHVQSVVSGRTCPLGSVHFVAEGSRCQLQVCVAHSKHSQGATLIVNDLEDKLDAVVF